jgi:hypothetical protein
MRLSLECWRVICFDSHTDVAVAKSGQEIQAIGCNVQDVVSKKILRVGANGHIKDAQYFWSVVCLALSFG